MQKEIIIQAVKHWPKTLTPKELLERIDLLAQAILAANENYNETR